MDSRARDGVPPFASLLAVLVLAAACSPPHSPPAPASKSEALPPAPIALKPAPPSPRQEFEAIAKELLAGDNKYLGMAPVRSVEAKLANPALNPGLRYTALMELSVFEVREGETQKGIAHCEEAGRLLQELLPRLATDPNPVLADYQQARAVAYMRDAEVSNCVARHTAGACILPFRGDGIHQVTAPGQEALKSWGEVIRLRGGDLGAQWLLNIVAMTLGMHPDGVPEDLRIDFERHQSKAPLGAFTDVAPALGTDSFNMAGGVVVEDLDGDGLLDFVFSTSDPQGQLRLHRNVGDGTFEDASEESGLDQQLGGLNLVSTDYDNDGDADLLVLRGGWQADDGRIRKSLLRNDGKGRFEDVTRAAGLAEVSYPTQVATWADFNDDGDLDVFVGSEVSIAQDGKLTPFPSQLFRNEGNGTFVDVAALAGVSNVMQAKGATAGDYDDDGDMDLYVSNIGPNRLYRNEGGMRFTDVATQAGVVEPSGRSFAPWFFDYDEDGRLDLWVSAYDTFPPDLAADLLGKPWTSHPPKLYHNEGNGKFKDVAEAAGLNHPYLPMGANFGDIDNDGWLDMYLGTGDPDFTSLMPNVMLWNDHGERFLDVTSLTRTGHLQKGHGVAFADLDGDGDQDIVHQLGGFVHGDRFHDALFMNPGNGNHHLYLSLVGTKGNRLAIGARVEVEVQGPKGRRVLHRSIGSVSSFGGSSLFRHEIGLGDARRIEELRIVWPTSRERQVFTDVPIDSHVEAREGEATLRVVPVAHTPFALN